MVTIRLFGTLRLDSGVKSLTLEAKNVRELYPLVLRALQSAAPDCAVTEGALRACLVAVNGRQVSPRAVLRDGDEVWLYPPSAGG